MQAEIRDGYWACFDTDEAKTEPGPRLVELVDARLTALADRFAPTYPAAMKILLTERESLTTYPRFPAEHHHRIRPSKTTEAVSATCLTSATEARTSVQRFTPNSAVRGKCWCSFAGRGDAYVEQFADQRDKNGHRLMVRSGSPATRSPARRRTC
ncbi:hypothetical protein MAHJHV63_15490 [Mycobacterium avium subsp. hominissuis]